MPRSLEEHRFQRTADHEYVCVTWFERDRQNVRLETSSPRPARSNGARSS